MLKPVLAAFCLLLSCATARAEEYVIFFSATGPKGEVEKSHTYAIFLKQGKTLESRTISWMPQTRKIAPNAMRSEDGINLDVTETNRWAKEVGATVKRYGPYRVDDGLFDLADAQVKRLESGVVKYKYADGRQGTNAAHAISDIWVPKKGAIPVTCAEDTAVYFKTWYLAGGSHNWLLKELQLEKIKEG
jgi:hypothetical protein